LVLILRLLHHRWSLPLVEEEEDDWCGGGALGAPPCVALLLVPSRSRSVRNGMISLGLSSPSKVRSYPLYTGIGQVHDSLGRCVYGLHAPESRRVLQQRSMDRGIFMEPKKPWASSGCSVLTLCVLGYVGLDWPSLGGPSEVFVVAKEVGSRG
jgi:hypothetical protein